jgi:hypothetical protein
MMIFFILIEARGESKSKIAANRQVADFRTDHAHFTYCNRCPAVSFMSGAKTTPPWEDILVCPEIWKNRQS